MRGGVRSVESRTAPRRRRARSSLRHQLERFDLQTRIARKVRVHGDEERAVRDRDAPRAVDPCALPVIAKLAGRIRRESVSRVIEMLAPEESPVGELADTNRAT